MRRVALCATMMIASMLALPSAAPADSPADQEHLALLVVQKNMQAAIEVEKDAFIALKQGNETEARTYLAQSAQIMGETDSAARLLTLPKELTETGPLADGSTWRGLSDLVERIQLQDENVFKAKGLEQHRLGMIQWAIGKKNDILAAVTAQLKDADCTGITNLEGPVVVNNVPQGKAELYVGASCKEPEKSIYVDIPLDLITHIDPDKGDTAKLLRGGKVAEIDLHGAKSGGATLETSPDPTDGVPLVSEVVPIAGDSTTEIVDEIM